ncbi:MAG TPA: transcription termination factor NusA [Bacillota bacterium]
MNLELIGALQDLERERGIDADTLIEAIEAALISAFRRNFGSAQDVVVRLDRETGDIRVIARKRVVEEVTDESLEISLEDARGIDPSYRVGDEAQIEVTPREFGRIAAQTAKQVVMQRLREAERDLVYEEFISREGDIVTGVVRRVLGRNVFVDLGRSEAILLPSEQIPREYYRQGERIKTYIVEVRKTTKGPQIVLSRSHPGLLKRLFELEVPEIHEGYVEIKAIAREAGARSKVAVTSWDERIDPVGACVGPRGSRVQSVVNELKGEKIDIVRWDDDPQRYVGNALSPARVVDVILHPEEKVAEVIVPDDQLSLAIGREGQNARLAAKLTGWRIDIKSASEMSLGYREAGDEARRPLRRIVAVDEEAARELEALRERSGFGPAAAGDDAPPAPAEEAPAGEAAAVEPAAGEMAVDASGAAVREAAGGEAEEEGR